MALTTESVLCMCWFSLICHVLSSMNTLAEEVNDTSDEIGTRSLVRPSVMSYVDDSMTPCHLPRLSERDFFVKCDIGYLGKRYVCDPDQKLSQTEISRIEEDILKKAEVYSYCVPCKKRPECSEPSAFTAHISDKEDQKSKPRKNNSGTSTKSVASSAADDGTRVQQITMQEYVDRYIKKKKYFPPVFIAVNVYAKFIYPHTLAMVEKHLQCANGTKLFKNVTKERHSFQEILEAYGQMTAERFRVRACSPNLTVLLFTGEIIEYTETGDRQASYRGPMLHVHHAFTNHTWLTSKIDELMQELNADNLTYSMGTNLLYKFFERFTALYEEAHTRRPHGIPFWAALAFGICSGLSVCAILVGNLVTSADRRGSRKAKHSSKGNGNRKWRAGFSGGMWASV